MTLWETSSQSHKIWLQKATKNCYEHQMLHKIAELRFLNDNKYFAWLNRVNSMRMPSLSHEILPTKCLQKLITTTYVGENNRDFISPTYICNFCFMCKKSMISTHCHGRCYLKCAQKYAWPTPEPWKSMAIAETVLTLSWMLLFEIVCKSMHDPVQDHQNLWL